VGFRFAKGREHMYLCLPASPVPRPLCPTVYGKTGRCHHSPGERRGCLWLLALKDLRTYVSTDALGALSQHMCHLLHWHATLSAYFDIRFSIIRSAPLSPIPQVPSVLAALGACRVTERVHLYPSPAAIPKQHIRISLVTVSSKPIGEAMQHLLGNGY
jgi:hypothetical protein